MKFLPVLIYIIINILVDYNILFCLFQARSDSTTSSKINFHGVFQSRRNRIYFKKRERGNEIIIKISQCATFVVLLSHL